MDTRTRTFFPNEKDGDRTQAQEIADGMAAGEFGLRVMDRDYGLGIPEGLEDLFKFAVREFAQGRGVEVRSLAAQDIPGNETPGFVETGVSEESDVDSAKPTLLVIGFRNGDPAATRAFRFATARDDASGLLVEDTILTYGRFVWTRSPKN